MGFLYPCRHGSYSDECTICASDRTTKAIKEQTHQQKQLAKQEDERRRKERDAQARRARKQERENALERAAAQARQDIEDCRREDERRAAANEQRQLQQLAEEREQQRQIEATDRLIARKREAEEFESQQRLAEERIRWRAAYKQRTGERDDEIIEAAWLSHRQREEEKAELDRVLAKLGDIAENVNYVLQVITGLDSRRPGLPKYVTDIPTPDDTELEAARAELASLGRWSLRRGRVMERIAEAKKVFAHEQLLASRAQAINTCWEATAATVASLRSQWPSQYLIWEGLMDSKAVKAVSHVPPIDHPLSPSELVSQGLDYRQEVIPVDRLATLVQDLAKQSDKVTELATAIVDADERGR